MNIAICDDNKKFIETIRQHLKFYADDRGADFHVYEFSKSTDLLECEIKFDIAVLDVEMPDCNGITLGKKLQEKNRHIVLMFITAYRKYLDDALDLSAARFFEKPLNSARFYRGLDYALERIDKTIVPIYLKENSETLKVSADDIIFIEIEKGTYGRTTVYTLQGKYPCSQPMSFWEDKLSGKTFIKPHKSYLVNLRFVTKYKSTQAELECGYIVPVSRKYRSYFRRMFIKFITEV